MQTKMPTPGDLAAQPRRPLTARPIATDAAPPKTSPRPPALPESAPFRMRYEQGIRHSAMPKNQRLVALTIATFAEWETGAIEPSRTPGVPVLARSTGLAEGALREALYSLKDRGWLRREGSRPGDHRPSLITLLIPPTAQ